MLLVVQQAALVMVDPSAVSSFVLVEGGAASQFFSLSDLQRRQGGAVGPFFEGLRSFPLLPSSSSSKGVSASAEPSTE